MPDNFFRVKRGLVVNGSGSTILDIQGSQGQLFSITDSLSGSLFAVKDISGIPVLEAFSDNTVKLGTFNQEGLIVSGSSNKFGFNQLSTHTFTGSVSITGSITSIGNLIVTGSIDATGDITAFATSDIRLKENIKPIANAIDKINQIGGYTFTWNDDKDLVSIHNHTGIDVGVIAQEIELVLPEVVKTRDNGYKAVKYEKIVPLLIQAIKEQQKEINELRETIKNKL
jgi:hypothetical protein